MKQLVWDEVKINELPRVAADLLSGISDTKVWCFHGNLGAGKTTLIREICRQLGVEGEVKSPTFGIVHEYADRLGEPVYHMDFYRLKSPEEAFDLGYENYLYSSYFCFIEWPEKAEGLLDMKKADIFMEATASGRKIIACHD